MTRPVAFVHTNDQQLLGAKLSAHSFRSRSRHADAFDVRIIRLEQTPQLLNREGQHYLWKGRMIPWHNADLQSFTPLRRMVPQLMGFKGRALITDPDVFAVHGDVHELLTMDMGGKAIWARNLPADQGGGPGKWASSVMLLDCERLAHWRWDEQIEAMFAGKLDYKPWSQLADEDPATIGVLPDAWNSFDHLDAGTQLVHMTQRLTQPWKTGLPINYNINNRSFKARLRQGLRDLGLLPVRRFQPHPDPNQETYFFSLLCEALKSGEVSMDYVRQSIADGHVRTDAPDILRRLGCAAVQA